VLAYDPKLMNTLADLKLDTPLPVLWPLFRALAHVPVLALRGANSDILSADTLNQMKRTHPRLEAVTVPDQGHAPALEGTLVDRIVRFAAMIEGYGSGVSLSA
jgi:pimeloyl-ACP methyl ester carboxylesterase